MTTDKKYNLVIITGVVLLLLVIGFIVFMAFFDKSSSVSKKQGKSIRSILAIGDSNTQANFSYADKLRAAYPNITVKKISENGQNTSWMLQQLQNELATNKYDAIVILGGSNDVYGGMSVEKTKENLANMNNLIKSKGSIAVFITPPNKDFYTGRTDANQKKLYDLVDWMKRQNFDVFVNFKDITNNQNLFSSTDGYLHPQSQAHAILVQQIAKQLNLT